MDRSLIDSHRAIAIEVEVKHRSGIMADVSLGDLDFRIVSTFCTHPEVEVALYYTGREPNDCLSAVIHCPICGYMESLATLLMTPAQMVKQTAGSRAVFGESDRRYFMSNRAYSRGAGRLR